jgi:tRNA(fMet)-specific endonuclease VapC
VIKRFMLDTNTVSYMMKGTSLAARTRLIQLAEGETACISAITEAELRYGFAKRPAALALLPLYEELLAFLQVLPWGTEQARTYGKLRAKQEASGKPLESMDLLIAAHAISIGAVLVTRDKVFRHVNDLVGIESWATDL